MHCTRLIFMAKKHLNTAILKVKCKQTSVYLDFPKPLLDGDWHPKVDKTSHSTRQPPFLKNLSANIY